MATYTPLQSITLTDISSSITFSNIDQTYTDLVVVVTASITTGTQNLNLRFNGDSTSGLYSATWLTGDGAGAASARQSSVNSVFLTYYGYLSTTLGIHKININNYSNTTTNKAFIARTDNVSNGLTATTGLWRNSNAITSITLFPSASTFAAGATFDLYGIAAGTPKAMGGVVYKDATYYYHVFKSSGIFTPLISISADVLVVAGGGSGGNSNGGGGGGGAGGIFYATAQTLYGAQTVTIGAGGASVGYGTVGNPGVNTTFGTLTAAIGGGKGAIGAAGTYTGGSGGGQSYSYGPGTSTQTGTGGTGYGNSGGIATTGDPSAGGGGGGGAGAVGGAGDNATISGGVGGAGLNTWSTWHTATGTGVSGYIAGGGGGGSYGGSVAPAGGSGGGGAGGRGAADVYGISGTVNTGSGGGGGGQMNMTGAGGSGLVIVRYTV